MQPLETEIKQCRKIIHIDMDAFFASIEQRDFVKYRGKPVIVGGKPESRGVVATCSYEARKFGIKSAMSTKIAFRLCPNAIFVPPRFEVYKQVSKQIRAIFYSYTDDVEPLSIDEAYLDVSGSHLCHGSATLIAKAIQQEIWEKLQLRASAGVSYNKLLAKIASDMEKPNGLTVVTPEQGKAFIRKLPVRKIYGVGKVTEQKMVTLNLRTCADIENCSLVFLQQHFGLFSQFLYNASRGIDERPVKYNPKRLSISKETTLVRDRRDLKELWPMLEKLSRKVFDIAKPQFGRTLTLKVKYSNYQLISRRMTITEGYQSVEQMLSTLQLLVAKTEVGQRYVRLLGVGLSNWLVTE